MSMFGNLSNQGLEEAQDRLGGGFQPLDTDIYTGTIKALYAGKSASGAQSVSLILDIQGKEYKETIYITNKKGENFFLNKQDASKKVPLPGFTTIDDICLVATGKPLCEQDTEEKVVKLWDKDAGKELPKSVPMLTDALGKTISVAIVRQIVNKNVLQGTEYVPTAETREENFIDKVFDTDSKFTVVEAKQGATEAKFWDGWLERNKGQTRDKRTIKDGAEAGSAGRPPRPAGAAPQAGGAQDGAPRKSLFGKKD